MKNECRRRDSLLMAVWANERNGRFRVIPSDTPIGCLLGDGKDTASRGPFDTAADGDRPAPDHESDAAWVAVVSHSITTRRHRLSC
jgi:hypothetical protein